MTENTKKEYELMSPPVENEVLPEEFVEPNVDTQETGCVERKNIDFIGEDAVAEADSTEETEEEIDTSFMKIKEVRYGFSVLTNIGNYENIRTQIEVSAEIEDNSQMLDCIDILSRQIKNWGRNEYKKIKAKATATLPNRQI